jgi:hypothetical protein
MGLSDFSVFDFGNFNCRRAGIIIDVHQHIELEKTYPYFGGQRYWMKCPGCFKRVRKIYSPPHKTHFRCRSCYDLMYQSQESNVYDGLRKKLAKANGMTPIQYDRMVFG